MGVKGLGGGPGGDEDLRCASGILSKEIFDVGLSVGKVGGMVPSEEKDVPIPL